MLSFKQDRERNEVTMNTQTEAQHTVASLTRDAKVTRHSTSGYLLNKCGVMIQVAVIVDGGIIRYDLGCGIYGYRTFSAMDASEKIANAMEVA